MPIFQIVLNQTLFGKASSNVFYYESATLSLADTQTIADNLRAAYNLRLGAYQGLLWSLDNFISRRVDVPGLPGVPGSFTLGPLGGANPNDHLPENAGIFVAFKAVTTVPNKAGNFIYGITEDVWDSSAFWDSTFLTDALLWAADTLTAGIGLPTNAFRISARFTGTPPFVSLFNQLTTFTIRDRNSGLRNRRVT